MCRSLSEVEVGKEVACRGSDLGRERGKGEREGEREREGRGEGGREGGRKRVGGREKNGRINEYKDVRRGCFWVRVGSH